MSRQAIIVCGSRDWTDQGSIIAALRTFPCHTVVIHGDCRGADRMAASVATSIGFDNVIAMPAQWDENGKAAGPIRNAAMLRVLLALRECGYWVEALAFALPSARGTRDMIRQAEHAGVKVQQVNR